MALLSFCFLVFVFNLNTLFADKFEDVEIIEDFRAGVEDLRTSARYIETWVKRDPTFILVGM